LAENKAEGDECLHSVEAEGEGCLQKAEGDECLHKAEGDEVPPLSGGVCYFALK
jgi:hypothetical protein